VARREHFFEPLARHAGSAYLRYSFTRGTEAEADALVRLLHLEPGARVLDVGCGPGRHAHALARRGMRVTGLDLAETFVFIAASGSRTGAAGNGAGGAARFVLGDALRLPARAGCFDAVVSICQGGFGLLGGGDSECDALCEMSGVLRAGGRLALSAPSAYFVLRFWEEGDSFDASSGVSHEVATVRGPDGAPSDFELWSSCFTPRELRLMCLIAGLEVEGIWSAKPGAYGETPPDIVHPEWLLVARKAAAFAPPCAGQGPPLGDTGGPPV
jgi:SAM-dependent methyltransferase